MFSRLRNLMRGEGKSRRDAVRADAMRHAQLAREEIRRAKDMRELAVLEAQYQRRLKGRGKPA